MDDVVDELRLLVSFSEELEDEELDEDDELPELVPVLVPDAGEAGVTGPSYDVFEELLELELPVTEL